MLDITSACTLNLKLFHLILERAWSSQVEYGWNIYDYDYDYDKQIINVFSHTVVLMLTDCLLFVGQYWLFSGGALTCIVIKGYNVDISNAIIPPPNKVWT